MFPDAFARVAEAAALHLEAVSTAIWQGGPYAVQLVIKVDVFSTWRHHELGN
jgi:hypothetical protein